ncbi:MAG: response regulator, partial [Bacilli bacterium]
EVLRRDGYQIYLAASGSEALAIVVREHPDLILLDMKIPGMDGLEILTNIRKTEPSMKVAMMTAYGELDLIKEAGALNAIGHFAKPFDIDDVRRFVRRVIGEAHDGTGL